MYSITSLAKQKSNLITLISQRYAMQKRTGNLQNRVDQMNAENRVGLLMLSNLVRVLVKKSSIIYLPAKSTTITRHKIAIILIEMINIFKLCLAAYLN